MRAFNYLFFDCDDTLFDFRRCEQEALLCTLARFELPKTPELLDKYDFINEQLWRRLEKGELTRDALMTRRFEEFLDYLYEQLRWSDHPAYTVEQPDEIRAEEMNAVYLDNLAEETVLLPDAENILRELKPCFHLILTTNGTARVQSSRLEKSAIRDCFEKIYISEQLGVDKPNRAFFDLICQDLAIENRERCLIIGDSLTADVQGGKQANIPVCWFNPYGREADPALLPDYSVRRLREIPRLLL